MAPLKIIEAPKSTLVLSVVIHSFMTKTSCINQHTSLRFVQILWQKSTSQWMRILNLLGHTQQQYTRTHKLSQLYNMPSLQIQWMTQQLRLQFLTRRQSCVSLWTRDHSWDCEALFLFSWAHRQETLDLLLYNPEGTSLCGRILAGNKITIHCVSGHLSLSRLQCWTQYWI